MFEFTDKKTAVALVKYERDRSKVVYGDYIAANGVTLDNVSDHVAALQVLAFPKFDAKTATDEDKRARKAFGNRVRNGLNYTLGKTSAARKAPATPVGAFLLAVEAFHAAGYTLSDARAVLADVYGSADKAAA